jgi:hypothetical protein
MGANRLCRYTLSQRLRVERNIIPGVKSTLTYPPYMIPLTSWGSRGKAPREDFGTQRRGTEYGFPAYLWPLYFVRVIPRARHPCRDAQLLYIKVFQEIIDPIF